MKHFPLAAFSCLLFGLPLFAQSAQTLIIPDLADGGGWSSVIVLTNTSIVSANATLTFNSDTSNGATQPWNPTFLEVGSTSGLVLVAGSTLYLHTPGTAATITQGWAQLNADAGIVAYAVFTFSQPGHQNEDATSPAVGASNRILMPYDDASGFVTDFAIVNPTASPESVSVGFRTTDGLVATDVLPVIPAMGHLTFVLSQQFPEIAGHLGLAEFYTSTGTISALSLRENPTLTDASAPVYFETGPPLITAPPSGGGDYTPPMYHAPRPTGPVQ
jgi:hypothetical protein